MIDLDANATTAIDPRVLEAMAPHLLAGGNPESRHSLGRKARKDWEDARELIASLLGANAEELFFTSGGTESNNLALLGYLKHSRNNDDQSMRRVLCSTIEHPAVSEPLEFLSREGLIELERIPVDRDGIVDLEAFRTMIDQGPRPALVSVMLANNETGAIEPVKKMAEMVASSGICFHTDAVQAVGRVDVNFHNLSVNLLSAGSHKMHGPPGIGLLLVRKGTRIEPILRGGGQQKALRPGTPPVALAVGLAEAMRLYSVEKAGRHQRWNILQNQFLDILKSKTSDLPIRIMLNGPVDQAQRLPQTLNLWIDHPSFNGELALMQLDLAGLALSLGSACASGSTRPSPVLLAMGFPPERARNSIRLSFSAQTTDIEIAKAAEILSRVIHDFVEPDELSEETDLS